MVRTSRTLTLDEYRAINKLMLRNGSLGNRITLWLGLRILPILAIPGAVWCAYILLFQRRPNEPPGPLLFGLFFSVLMILQPQFLRWKLKKLLAAQRLDRTWTIEASDDGVRSVLEDLYDTKFAWSYFDKVVEDNHYFLLVNSKRPAFISFAKAQITPSVLDELRGLAEIHVSKSAR